MSGAPAQALQTRRDFRPVRSRLVCPAGHRPESAALGAALYAGNRKAFLRDDLPLKFMTLMTLSPLRGRFFLSRYAVKDCKPLQIFVYNKKIRVPRETSPTPRTPTKTTPKKSPFHSSQEHQNPIKNPVQPGQTDKSPGKKACVSPRIRAARPAAQKPRRATGENCGGYAPAGTGKRGNKPTARRRAIVRAPLRAACPGAT